MQIKKKIIIIGSSGLIANNLINYFTKKKKKLNIFSRKKKLNYFSHNISKNNKFYHYSMLKKKKINFFNNSEILINLAYIKNNKKENINLIKNLIKIANGSNIKKFIHLSTAVVSGFKYAGILNEQSKNISNIEYHKTKLLIEDELKKKLSKKINLIILRPTEIISLNNHTIIDKIISRVRKKNLLNFIINYILNYRRLNIVSLPNVIAAIIFFCNKKNHFLNGTFIITDEDCNLKYYKVYNYINSLICEDYKISNIQKGFNIYLLSILYKIFFPKHSNPNIQYSDKKLLKTGFKKKITLKKYLKEIVHAKMKCKNNLF